MRIEDIRKVFDHQLSRSLALRTDKLSKRKAKIDLMRKWLLNHREDLHKATFSDLGKPASETDVTEIYPLISEAKHAKARLSTWAKAKAVESSMTFLGTQATVQYEPLGRCLIISPWNYPIMLGLGPIISAVAAGNTIVFKPSEFTPATNKVIGSLIREIFDEEEVVMIEGEVEETTALLAMPFDHIFFTGSPSVGKIVMEAAAKNLTSVTLELGGKSPCIVDESARLSDAAERIAWGKWTNVGQTCVAPDYLFVHHTKIEEFKTLIKDQVEKRYGDRSDYGLVVNFRHFDRVTALHEDAVKKGAKLIFGGSSEQETNFFAPTLLEHVSDDMAIMKEEVFGPVLTLMPYEDLEEVIEYINNRPKPLALYHYSTSAKMKELVAKKTSSGALVENDNVIQFGHPHLPMGGVNNSGIGKAHGKAGFLAFSHTKAVLKQRSGLTVVNLIYPPYTPLKKKVIELMLKYF